MESIWTEIIIKTPIGALDRAEAALHMATPLGLYVEDYSDFDSVVKAAGAAELIDDALMDKDRGHALVHIYFPPDRNMAECTAEVRARLTRAGLLESEGAFAIAAAGPIAEEDWANNWKQYFKPLHVGKGILIIPQWEDMPAPAGDPQYEGVKAVVRIDPGMAFGTGGHATTGMCLELIESFMDGRGAAGDHGLVDMLDIGCGSGILSIAALLLGAASARGVDIDVYAVQNARANAQNNGVADRSHFAVGNLFGGIDGQFDLIAANIVADVVIRLLQGAGRFLRPGGALILSGIIDDRAADVEQAAAKSGFDVAQKIRSDGWVALSLRAAGSIGNDDSGGTGNNAAGCIIAGTTSDA